MTEAGHIAGTYILTQVPRFFKYDLTTSEILLVVGAGSILDLDFIFGTMKGMKGDEHHDLVTHTPIAAFILWLLFILTLGYKFSIIVRLMLLAALMLHLFLDEAGYWFNKLVFIKTKEIHQINWYYPAKKFTHNRQRTKNNYEVIRSYFSKRANVVFEVGLVIVAVLLYFLGKKIF
jgi:hypothetical protein